MINVAIVEDDPGVREGVAEMLRRLPECQLVGMFSDGAEAIDGLPSLTVDVVLMDINMPRIEGPECIGALSASMPDTNFIVLTIYEDTSTIFKALAAGASGYLLKPITPEELEAAVKDVYAGGAPMTSSIARQVVSHFSSPQSEKKTPDMTDDLGPREIAILELLSQGDSYKDIARKLDIGYETVHTYIKRIYQKLHVHSRGQAVARYMKSSS